jgi:hypothetical protein
VPGHGQAVGAVHAVNGDRTCRAVDVRDLGGSLQEAVGEGCQASVAEPARGPAQGLRLNWLAPCSACHAAAGIFQHEADLLTQRPHMTVILVTGGRL